MYGPVIAAAAILLVVAAIALYLHDLAEARPRKAYDRIFEEGPQALRVEKSYGDTATHHRRSRGILPFEVQRMWLGHSRISITQNVYVHTNERQNQEAANLAARAILGS
jgi:integrase